MSILTRLLTIVFLLGSFLAAEAQSGKKPIKLRIKSEGNGTNITIDDNVSISLEEEADRILEELELGRAGRDGYVDKTIIIEDEDDLQDLIDELQELVGDDSDIYVDDRKVDENQNEVIIIDDNRPIIVETPRSDNRGKPMLGVYLDESGKNDGAKLTSVTKNGAAEQAGLRAGDLITAIDRNEIYSAKDLREAKDKYRPGDKVLIEYERNGRVYYTDLTFKSSDPSFSNNEDSNVISDVLDQIKDVVNVYIEDDDNEDRNHNRNENYNQNGRPMLGVYLDESGHHNGARISSLTRNGAAEEAGLKGGDIITAVDDHTIRSSSDLTNVKKNYRPGDRVLVEYRRNGGTYFTNLTFKSSGSGVTYTAPKTDVSMGSPMLGVYLDESRNYNGARVTSVTRNGAAELAGIRGGDIITGIDNHDIRSSSDLTNTKKYYKPGDRIEVEYRRDSRTYHTGLTLKSSNSSYNEKLGLNTNVNIGKPMMGVYLDESRGRNGAIITSVTSNGAAEKAGLRKGDLITAMDDRDIDDAGDLREAKKYYRPGDRILVEYIRDGRRYSTDLVFKSSDPTAVINPRPAPQPQPRPNVEVFPRPTPRPQVDVNPLGNTAYLGVQMQDLNPSMVDERNLDIDRGVYLTNVINNSPADQGGLRSGDIITHIDGEEVLRTNDITSILSRKRPGQAVEVVYFRRGEPRVADIQLSGNPVNNNQSDRFFEPQRERNPVVTNNSGTRRLVEETRPYLGVHFENYEDGGVKITHVESNSAASEAGLVKGDVITGFEAELVGNDKQLEKLIERQNAGDRVIIRFSRNGERRRTFATLQGKVESKWVDNRTNGSDLFGSIERNTGYNLRRHLDNPDLNFNHFEFYPNPNQGRFRLSFNLADAGNIAIQIYNAAGMVIFEEYLQPFENAFDKEIRLPYGTPPGIYLLYVNQGEKGMVKKMTIR